MLLLLSVTASLPFYYRYNYLLLCPPPSPTGAPTSLPISSAQWLSSYRPSRPPHGTRRTSSSSRCARYMCGIQRYMCGIQLSGSLFLKTWRSMPGRGEPAPLSPPPSSPAPSQEHTRPPPPSLPPNSTSLPGACRACRRGGQAATPLSRRVGKGHVFFRVVGGQEAQGP